MSHPSIAHFPDQPLPRRDHNPHAADQARRRIESLPDPYMAHAAPTKENLVGAVRPVSPAAEGGIASPLAHHAPAIPAPESQPTKEEPRPEHHTVRRTATANPLATPAATETAVPSSVEALAPPIRRSLPSRLRPVLVGIATFVVLYFVFKPQLLLSEISYLTQSKTAGTPATQAAAEVPPNPTISIPKISVNAPVVYATDNSESAILTDLESGVVHYAGTSLPGQAGNSVIFGHSSNDWWEPGNYKFVFVLLDKLVPGDSFSVNYNSHQYLYQVTSSTVVDPTDVAVLDQTSTPEMTLITCSPPGTSWKRLVVVAKQISPAPAVATTTPNPSSTAAKGTSTLPSNSPSLTDDISSWWHSALNFLGGGGSSPKSNSSSGNTPATPSGGILPATQ